jgi:hypothetical protein
MKRIISLLALLTLMVSYSITYASGAPPPPADHQVMIHFDASDGCPEWTRVINNSGGNAARCQNAAGQLQADAVCVQNGDIIEWRPQGNQSFSITNKSATNPPLSSCAATISGPPNRYRCTVAVSSGSYHYNIVTSSGTSSCLLDPRIFFN